MKQKRWLLGFALVLCAALVLGRLALVGVPWQYVTAFTAPAAMLAWWNRRPRLFWQRAVFVLLVQGGAIAWAVHAGPAPSKPAALTCTILPTLAYACVRRREHDVALGLFLAFCVFLIGCILGGMQAGVLLAFGALALLILRTEAQLVALRHGQLAGPPQELAQLPLLRPTLQLLLPCCLLFVLLDRGIGALPMLHRVAASQVAAAPAPMTSGVGLSDSFLLNGSGNLLGNLRGEQLVGTRHVDGSPVPSDFYLRSGFFAVPGLDDWQTGALSLERTRDERVALTKFAYTRGLQWLEVERFAATGTLVPIPPCSREIRYLPDLRIDRAREWLRQDDDAAPRANSIGNTEYVVGYESQPTAPTNLDLAWAQRGLLELPAGLEVGRFRELLQRWDATGSPQRIVAQIAAGLAGHCRYSLQEPAGPFRHTLMNFLFAAEDRRGYCMHFASSAALLLRLSGIPCRIGVGLYGGEVDAGDPALRIFGSQHAHAWVEIPWQGIGFTVFDPTPPAGRGVRMPSADPVEEPEAMAAAGTSDRLDGLQALLGEAWPVAALLALLLLGWRRGPRPTAQSRPAPTAAERSARRMLGLLLRELAAAGCPRQRGQTLEQHLQQMVAMQLPEQHVKLAYMAYQEVRFGGRSFDATREQLLRTAIRSVEQLRRDRAEATAAVSATGRTTS